MASYRLITRGWQPGTFVTAFLAAQQEAARQHGLPPSTPNTLKVGGGTADASGKLDITLMSNTPLLLYGERLDPRDPQWVQTMAQPAWQTPTNR
jgi:hypothetical protein